MSQVQDIIDRVSQDIRLQLSADINTPGQPILIDYTNRIHKQMLRFSRWDFIKSEPKAFMTVQGQTDYWIGPTAQCPPGLVNSELNLTDVDWIKKDEVRDISNIRQLAALGASPIGLGLNQRSGQYRQGPPSNFFQDHNDPNVLHLYPASDNNNAFQPIPASPILQTSTGGALPARTEYYVLTYVDNNTPQGESQGSPTSVSIYLQEGQLATVISPTMIFDYTDQGIEYGFYNVYAADTEGSETLQNTNPIPLGTNWTEPTSGLTGTGQSVPTQSSIAQMGGYIVQFRYYKKRILLQNVDDFLQIPDDYEDVVVQGVLALAWKFLDKSSQASASYEAYKGGLTEMVWDKNLFPDRDFVRPDPATYVNSQRIDWNSSDNNR